jgi:putative oxidoreductase
MPLPPGAPQIGFWAVLHEIRSEFAQLSCCVFLMLSGPGPWSIDALFANKHSVVEPLPRNGFTSAVPAP